jgi:RND family efflux transporter MFP subunit
VPPARHWLVLSLAAATTITLTSASACNRSADDEAADDPVRVAVQEARLDTLRDAASAPGIVVPSAAGDWTIYIEEPAEIVELPHKEGDEVAVGDVLVRFQVASLSQESAASELAVLEATSDVQRAREAAAQTQSLFDRGLVARLEHESRQAALAAAEARLQQATSQLEIVKSNESRTVVRARFPGTVVNVWHAPGDMLTGSSTDPILRVVDRSRVQVAVQLPIAQVARIAPGQLATVRSFGGDTPELATVSSRADTTDANVPTAEVRLSFTQPPTLPVDTPVSVEIVFDQRANVLVVPAAALMTDAQGSYVVVVGDDERAHRRDVRIGMRTRDLVHIATGLNPGERVIVSGVGEIGEGTPVATGR